MTENTPDQPKSPTFSQKNNSVGPIVGIIIIVGLLVIGGLYFIGQQVSLTQEKPTPEMILDTPDSTLKSLEAQGTSDELEDIEADLETTDLSNIDAELEIIELELNI